MNALAPTVAAEALALAATNADILRAVRDGQHSSPGNVGHACGRPTKNMARDIAVLTREGLVEKTDAAAPYTLTAAGLAALQGVDLAQGRAAPATNAQPDPEAGLLLRHDQLRPNPLQPRKRFDRQKLDELKASIVADLTAGGPGVLQNLVVFPADAEGAHVISAGERRWRAVGELIAEGVWPDGKRLRAIERENSPGQTAFIGLVENGQRDDLTMLEEARAYAELIAETDWSARHAALQTGRDPRTVQEMLKVLREAAPADIAAHEAGEPGKTWEWLRETVKEHRAAEPEPAQRDLEEVTPPPRAVGTLIGKAGPGPIIGGGGTSQPPKPPRMPSGDDVELTPVQTLALVELAYKLQTPNIGGWAPVRKYWLHAEFSELAAHQFVAVNHAAGPGGPHAGVHDAGYRWLAAHGYVRGEITADQIWTARDAAGSPPPSPSIEPVAAVYATPWLNVETAAPPQTGFASPSEATGATKASDAEFAAAEAVLGKVVRALDGSDGLADPIGLLKDAGVAFPLTIDEGLAIVSNDGEPVLDLVGCGDLADDLMKARGLLLLTALNTFAEWARREPGDQPAEMTTHKPHLPIRRSITPDHITCLEDGRKLTTIGPYLRAHYGLTPQGYRTRWGLPLDYPMTAPNASYQLNRMMRGELGIDTDHFTQIEDEEAEG